MTMKRYLLLLLLLLPLLPVSAQTLDTVPDGDTSLLDFRVLDNLQQHRSPSCNTAMKVVSASMFASPAIPAGMALAAWGTDNHDLLHSSATIGGALALTAAVTMGMKALVARPRPYVTYEGRLVPVSTEHTHSFPSGHTSFVFSTATSLTLQYPRWYVAVPAYLWAGAVGFSRMYLGVHYPSDVLTGAVVGTACAIFAYQIEKRVLEANNLPQPQAVVIPITFSF